MSGPNRYFTALGPRSFGPPPPPPHEPQHPPPPGTGRPPYAHTLRPLYPASSTPSTPSEVIVLSDSEDETPVRLRDRGPLPRSIDLTRDPASSTSRWRDPVTPPPRPSLRPQYSQSFLFDGTSGSQREPLPYATGGIGFPAQPQHPTVTTGPPPPTWNDDFSPFRQKPQASTVTNYQAPPQNGSRVAFSPFARQSIFSPLPGPKYRTSTGAHTEAIQLDPPQSPHRSSTPVGVKPQVCVSCTRVKLNCDGAHPCGPCRQRGDRGCVYSICTSSSPRTTFDPQPVQAATSTKAAEPVQPAEPVEHVSPARPVQPVGPAQHMQHTQQNHHTEPISTVEISRSALVTDPAPSVQPAQPEGAAKTTERRSMVVKLKLPSDKAAKRYSATGVATLDDVSKSSVNRPTGFLDGSSPPSYGEQPEGGVDLLLERDILRRGTEAPVQQNISDSEAPASEQEHHDGDGSEVSGLLNITLLQGNIEGKLEEMEFLMEEVHKKLQSWREMFVQANLRQATIDMRNYSRPRLDPSAGDPFRAITEQRRSALGTEARSELHVHARPQDKSQNKKLTTIRTPERPFRTGATLLPKYKSIGRVSTSFLAPNYRTAKYRPYDAEDEVQDPDATEKYAELEQRFNNNYPGLKSQRHCQELVWLWQPWVEELLACLRISKSDVLYFFTQDHFDPDREFAYSWSGESAKVWREEQMRRCRTCELADPESRWTHFSETFNSLSKPDDRSLALAGLVAHAFHRRTNVSLWHVAIGGLLQPRYEDPQAMPKRAPNFCVICFRHHCPDHGSYEEPNDEDHSGKDAEELKAYINDEEQDHNLRKFMSLPVRKRHDDTKHMCGVFCVEPSQKLSHLIGRRLDGTITGESRKASHARQVLADDEFCSSSCFWDVTTRHDIKISEVRFQPFMSQSQKMLVDRLIRFYLNNKRGPCLISRIVKDVSCLMVFHYTIYCITHVPHPVAESGATSDSSTAQRHFHHARKKKKPLPIIDVSRSAELDQRPPFMPCSHDGPCHSNPACTCSRSKVHCERFCGCDNSCKRRFRGCSCTMRGSKLCFKDSRCECWKLNRECDPSLCGKCGVVDVLDSANKYRDDVRRGRCRNNRIQLALPAPTTKAPSQVQGYGLYSRADIPNGEFIGEYTGEIVSISEGDRRGAMYHVLNQEYLFVINRGQEIDASNNGNKMRFMNNSQREENINVEPKKLLCSGVVRVGLFAKRFVKAGEELLYNYNYPESVVKNFWEPGERPSSGRRLIPTGSERIARTTGANKLADESISEMREESSQSPLPRHPKRKRPFGESPLASHRFDALNHNDDETESSAHDMQSVPVIDDTEDSDYETNGLVSDEVDIDDEPDDESELDTVETQHTRTRRSSNRRSLRGGGGLDRGNSTSKGPGGSRSREGREQRLSRSQSRSHSTTSSGVTRNDRRKRKIGPYDKRLGGRAQQQAWRTRRLRESLGLSMSPSAGSA